MTSPVTPPESATALAAPVGLVTPPLYDRVEGILMRADDAATARARIAGEGLLRIEATAELVAGEVVYRAAA